LAESKPRAHAPAPCSARELGTQLPLQDQALLGRSKQRQGEMLAGSQLFSRSSAQTSVERQHGAAGFHTWLF